MLSTRALGRVAAASSRAVSSACRVSFSSSCHCSLPMDSSKRPLSRPLLSTGFFPSLLRYRRSLVLNNFRPIGDKRCLSTTLPAHATSSTPLFDTDDILSESQQEAVREMNDVMSQVLRGISLCDVCYCVSMLGRIFFTLWFCPYRYKHSSCAVKQTMKMWK